MESVDSAVLTEEFLDHGTDSKKTLDGSATYPTHVDLGRLIVTSQPDLLEAIGDRNRAKTVCDIFTGDDAADSQMSKLIHSNLDMDRMDYLLRDSHAAGVPYGMIDIHYILNAIKVSPTGMVGVTKKAMPAAEQFLMARHFMHRAVYYHKTTVAFEATCQHLLRRLRARSGENYAVPKTGAEIEEKAQSTELVLFTDAFVDKIVIRAIEDSDSVVKALACAIHRRRPPKLLKEVAGWQDEGEYESRRSAFRANCKAQLTKLAEKHGLPLGRFLFWNAKPIRFEERAAKVTPEEARSLRPEAQEQSIRVFDDESPGADPRPIMDIKYSMMHWCASHLYNITRLYFVHSPEEFDAEGVTEALRNAVKEWDRS
jgi:HD superfamily phosphohydrolase